jgi:hypothetical protein
LRISIGTVAAGEIMHLALPPIALCPSGERQIGLQKAGIGSPTYFYHLSGSLGLLLVAGHLEVFWWRAFAGEGLAPGVS